MKVKSIVPPDGGINKYLPNHLIPDNSWITGNNIYFGVGFLEKCHGWIKFMTNPLSEGIRNIDNYYKYNGDAYLMFITNNKIYKYNDNDGNVSDLFIPPTWEALNPVSKDDTTTYANFCIPTVSNGHYYKCTTNGTTGSTQPTWPINGTTVTDGSAVWTDMGLLSSMSGTNDKPIFAENAEDKFIITNYVDNIKYWNGSNDIIRDLSGTNELEGYAGSNHTLKAKCMLYSNGFLILGHTEEDGKTYPQRIRWSQYGNIEKWINEIDGSGQAGAADLTEGVDWVQRILPLNNYVIVYKERSIQVLSYVGGDLIWDKRPAIIGTGLLAPKAIIDLGDEHIFIGPDNIYSFDLIEPKIAGDDIGQYFFRELLNPTYAHRIETFFIEEVPEAWFVFASIESDDGTLDKAIVYNTDTKKWSIRDMPMTAFGYYNIQETTTYNDLTDVSFDEANFIFDTTTKLSNSPLNICGDSQGYIYKFDGTSKDGQDMGCSVVSKLFDLDNPGILKRLMRIQLMVSREEEYNLRVYVGTADNVDEPITWHGPYNMLLSQSKPPWVDVDLTSRYFCVKFETLGKNQPFKLTGYNLWYEERSNL
jgi:hypothetical protein